MTSNNDSIHTTTRQSRQTLAGVVIGSSFLGTIALISPFILMQLRSPLPYMSTPRRKVLAALEEITSRRYKSPRQPQQSQQMITNNTTSSTNNNNNNNKNSQINTKRLRYYDIGSGDGETVLAAASAGFQSTGIELNSTLYALSSLRRSMLFSPRAVRRRASFVWGDMWKQNLSDADAVLIFGVRPLMGKVAEKIGRECRVGTFVLAYRFRIPLLSGEVVGGGKLGGGGDDCDGGVVVGRAKGVLDAKLIYDVEEMRIYQLQGDTVQNQH